MIKYSISTIVLLLAVAACSSGADSFDLENPNAELEEPFNIECIDLPYAHGGDTLYFNTKLNLTNIELEKDCIIAGNWFINGTENDKDFYVLCQRKIEDYVYPELRVYDNSNNEIYRLVLSDTSYILDAPERRMSRAYRKANWIYIESGVINPEHEPSIVKVVKLDIMGMLGPEYDERFISPVTN